MGLRHSGGQRSRPAFALYDDDPIATMGAEAKAERVAAARRRPDSKASDELFNKLKEKSRRRSPRRKVKRSGR